LPRLWRGGLPCFGGIALQACESENILGPSTRFPQSARSCHSRDRHQTAYGRNDRPPAHKRDQGLSLQPLFSPTTMTVTSPYDDLTIPELFHALKERLYGISVNGTRCAALLNPPEDLRLGDADVSYVQ